MIYAVDINGARALVTHDPGAARAFVLDFLTWALAYDKNADRLVRVREYGNLRLLNWADLRREGIRAPYRMRRTPGKE